MRCRRLEKVYELVKEPGVMLGIEDGELNATKCRAVYCRSQRIKNYVRPHNTKKFLWHKPHFNKIRCIFV